MIFVKPKAGLIIRHPGQPQNLLPADGAFVEPSTGWKRLINDGDVIVDTAKTDNPVASAKAKDSKGGKN